MINLTIILKRRFAWFVFVRDQNAEHRFVFCMNPFPHSRTKHRTTWDSLVCIRFAYSSVSCCVRISLPYYLFFCLMVCKAPTLDSVSIQRFEFGKALVVWLWCSDRGSNHEFAPCVIRARVWKKPLNKICNSFIWNRSSL